MKSMKLAFIVAGLLLLSTAFAAESISPDPLYIRTDNGWKGFFAHNDEYAEFLLVGKDIKLQDPYHVLLRAGFGCMLTFADKKEFKTGKELLEAHKEWEIEYWRDNAPRVESADRDDLRGSRQDIKVTEMTIYNQQGRQMKSYLIGLAASDGVFVFSLSPAGKKFEPLLTEFISSLKLVKKRLDIQEETKKIRSEPGPGKKK